jgi:hypothetical protein
MVSFVTMVKQETTVIVVTLVTMNVRRSSCKVPVFCKISNKLEFFRQILVDKFPNIKFHENMTSGTEFFHVGGWT